MKKKIIIPTLILAAALTGCTPNENESSPGVIGTFNSSGVTDSTVESTTESTVESVAGTQSTTTSVPTSGSEPTSEPEPEEPSSEPTSEPTSQPTSESTSSTQPTQSQTSSSKPTPKPTTPTNPEVPYAPNPEPSTDRKPKDYNHDIYGDEMTGGWVTKPGGTYWKEGSNFYRSREDAQYDRNAVPQGEVDGDDPSLWSGITFH